MIVGLIKPLDGVLDNLSAKNEGKKSFPQKPGLKPTISLLTDVFQTLSTYYILREINFGDYKHRKVPFLNVLTPSPNFRHQFFNVKVSTQSWYAPGELQMCPLTSLVQSFGSTMTLAPARTIQSWKKGVILANCGHSC